ncbi:hypothetical protein EVAR_18180_1 [Eumeta japonica]|uniref:Uncharacterized protein n=1 Tax=Eumeta variegata TaxID=151549 RepID=A0A4C1UV66_EUMVA|nr:hypothetical protein EVAR_18180_1 [Eumeta japonica]
MCVCYIRHQYLHRVARVGTAMTVVINPKAASGTEDNALSEARREQLDLTSCRGGREDGGPARPSRGLLIYIGFYDIPGHRVVFGVELYSNMALSNSIKIYNFIRKVLKRSRYNAVKAPKESNGPTRKRPLRQTRTPR